MIAQLELDDVTTYMRMIQQETMPTVWAMFLSSRLLNRRT